MSDKTWKKGGEIEGENGEGDSASGEKERRGREIVRGDREEGRRRGGEELEGKDS